MANMIAATDPSLKKDDLIVITGAGGFIAGSLVRYFHDQGFTNLGLLQDPAPDWQKGKVAIGIDSLIVRRTQQSGRRRP